LYPQGIHVQLTLKSKPICHFSPWGAPALTAAPGYAYDISPWVHQHSLHPLATPMISKTRKLHVATLIVYFLPVFDVGRFPNSEI